MGNWTAGSKQRDWEMELPKERLSVLTLHLPTNLQFKGNCHLLAQTCRMGWQPKRGGLCSTLDLGLVIRTWKEWIGQNQLPYTWLDEGSQIQGWTYLEWRPPHLWRHKFREPFPLPARKSCSFGLGLLCGQMTGKTSTRMNLVWVRGESLIVMGATC